jgi:hypothetical protein
MTEDVSPYRQGSFASLRMTEERSLGMTEEEEPQFSSF